MAPPVAEATLPRRQAAPKRRAKGGAPRNARAVRNSRAIANARAAHAAAAQPATRPRPAAPRRRSGPVAAPRSRVAQRRGAVVLDSLLRGRGWVALVGVLLAGIVFLNVSVLELNRGIAQTDAQATALERTNSGLRARVAALDSAERIQAVAEQHGFYLPQPGDIGYLRPSAGDARRAAAQITAPGPQTGGQPAASSLQTSAPAVPQQQAATAPPTAAPPSATPQAAGSNPTSPSAP